MVCLWPGDCLFLVEFKGYDSLCDEDKNSKEGVFTLRDDGVPDLLSKAARFFWSRAFICAFIDFGGDVSTAALADRIRL